MFRACPGGAGVGFIGQIISIGWPLDSARGAGGYDRGAKCLYFLAEAATPATRTEKKQQEDRAID